MWRYKKVTREEFENRKDYAEQVLSELGAEKIGYGPEDEDISIAAEPRHADTFSGGSSLYKYGDWYYRVDEVLFPEKPFIVFEAAKSMDEVRTKSEQPRVYISVHHAAVRFYFST